MLHDTVSLRLSGQLSQSTAELVTDRDLVLTPLKPQGQEQLLHLNQELSVQSMKHRELVFENNIARNNAKKIVLVLMTRRSLFRQKFEKVDNLGKKS